MARHARRLGRGDRGGVVAPTPGTGSRSATPRMATHGVAVDLRVALPAVAQQVAPEVGIGAQDRVDRRALVALVRLADAVRGDAQVAQEHRPTGHVVAREQPGQEVVEVPGLEET